jgi:peptidoglycan/xylan/chitin deacetylase (PgdA/CDA1 family)
MGAVAASASANASITIRSNGVLNAKSVNSPGRLLVCFDFEGSHGMPHQVPYDLHKGTEAILAELSKYNAHAVFFVVGRMVEDNPDIIRSIAAAGHEIGLHGYEHHHLSRYDADELALFGTNLIRAGALLTEMTGSRPVGFRAPYLLFPHFYRREVYALLKSEGYRWVSNREVRYPVELLRPGLIPIRSAWRGRNGAARLRNNRFLLPPLNAKLLVQEDFAGSLAGRLRWLLGKRDPFMRDGLVEVPMYAPIDCDLLGLPTPDSDTQEDVLAYSRAVLTAAASRPGELTSVTFHDWIVSGGNRLALLGDVLAAARDSGMSVSTIAANPDWLPTVA